MEGVVRAGDFDLLVAGVVVGRLEEEGELLVERQVVWRELDGRALGLFGTSSEALAEEGDDGARGVDGDVQGEGAAVFQGRGGGGFVAGVEFGGRSFGVDGFRVAGLDVEGEGELVLGV
jgi:hypothetical protein